MARDYLGVGTEHPANVNIYGQQALVEDIKLVKQSLRRLFSTPIGTDFMNRSYGTHLALLLFEPNSTTQQSVMEYLIREAVDKWERRVRYVDTDFEIVSAEQLNARVNFQLLGSNEIESFIYPFYRETRF
jgi:phage baseplate assembly protein W